MPPSLFPPSLLLRAAFAAVCLLAPAGVRAHGDDQAVIAALSEEIARSPSADLLLRRGELFRHQREWELAEADFAAAARIEPDLALTDFFRARTKLESGAPGQALPLVERYLVAAPREPEGWFLRGEILAALGQAEAGAAAYAEGTERAPSPRPEHYLRRAQLLAGDTAASQARALAVLDEGIARVGPVVSLVERAIALELQRGNHPGALERITAAMQQAPRRESWLVRQGDVLVQCGRREEAIAAYRAALSAIAELPARHRETVPMEKLAREARTSLERLATR